MENEAGGRWHPALAYALLGRPLPDLDPASGPDPPRLAAELTVRAGGAPALGAEIQRARYDSAIWPVPVPADLMVGLPAAQFAAALRQLIDLVGAGARGEHRIGRNRPLDRQEQALQAEVPPHHGG